MKMVNIEELSDMMYHEAFETDSDMQKWDGGCWIRYKLFEKCRDKVTIVDAVPVVRCGKCRWYNKHRNENFGYCTWFSRFMRQDGYCHYGEGEESVINGKERL